MTIDVLEGETQDAEWERALAEQAGALGALSAGPAHQPLGVGGQEEGRGQGRSEWREERQSHRLWRYIPASGSHCSRRGTRLQRHAERKVGWGGGGGGFVLF